MAILFTPDSSLYRVQLSSAHLRSNGERQSSMQMVQNVMDSLKKRVWPFEFKSLQCPFYIAKNPTV
jgi:hypothetical protein